MSAYNQMHGIPRTPAKGSQAAKKAKSSSASSIIRPAYKPDPRSGKQRHK